MTISCRRAARAAVPDYAVEAHGKKEVVVRLFQSEEVGRARAAERKAAKDDPEPAEAANAAAPPGHVKP